MTAQTRTPLGVADALVESQLKAFDFRLRRFRQQKIEQWRNKHVLAPPNTSTEIIEIAADRISEIVDNTEETRDNTRPAG